MIAAQARTAVPLLAWCLMPNHIHLVVRPVSDGDLSRWMHWVLTAQTQRHRVRYKSTGRIWQGRYKSIPVQSDRHLVMLLRYVERNPVRAGLVARARDWRWSSYSERISAPAGSNLLSPSPAVLPARWSDFVDEPQTTAEVEAIRSCITHDRPLGETEWTQGMIDRNQFAGTLHARGRPREL
jgi:putative transposase